jgi:hypothetical protein
MTEHGGGNRTFGSDEQRLVWLEQEAANIDLSSLGMIVQNIVSSMDDGPERRAMLRIMALKQGTFQDLEDPQFQSFLVSYLRIDASLLRMITQMIRSSVYASREDAVLEAAARGGAMSASLTSSELQGLLSRRKLVR